MDWFVSLIDIFNGISITIVILIKIWVEAVRGVCLQYACHWYTSKIFLEHIYSYSIRNCSFHGCILWINDNVLSRITLMAENKKAQYRDWNNTQIRNPHVGKGSLRPRFGPTWSKLDWNAIISFSLLHAGYLRINGWIMLNLWQSKFLNNLHYWLWLN